MYNFLKKTTLKIIPKKTLFRYEYFLRYFYFLNYRGNKYECNICEKKLNSFISIVSTNKLCPRCGSINRTRRLWKVLNDEFSDTPKKILDFSPSRSFYRKLKKSNNTYISSDLSGNFLSDVRYNIKNIDSNKDNFDLIICYHILEHIDNDTKAISELFRVIKKEGHCIIQTPFKTGEIYENKSITTPKEREKHFGQSDHVRIYSVEGLKYRLENCGFIVDTKNYNENSRNINGFSTNETVLICKKP